MDQDDSNLTGVGIFAGIHRGFAPPRIKDAISSEGQDIQLEGEKSWNFELGTRAELSSFMGFEFTFYHMDFSNQVLPVSESAGGTGTGYINAGRTNHRGIETEINLLVSDIVNMPGNLGLNLNTNVSRSVFSGDRFIIKKIATEVSNDSVFVNVNGNNTPYAPGITISGSLLFEGTGGFGIRLGGNFTGKQYTDVLNTEKVIDWKDSAENDPEYNYVQATASGRIGPLSSYFVMNVTAWYNFSGGISLNLSVKNLMNERFIVSRRPQGIRVGLSRLLSIGLSYDF